MTTPATNPATNPVTTPATGRTAPDRPAGAGAPLRTARDLLQQRLTARYRASGAGPSAGPNGAGPSTGPNGAGLGAGPAPLVVSLGAADTLGTGHDPDADLRPRATVHLTSRAVLIGPWRVPDGRGTPDGPDALGAGPPACGQCLAMRWQRLRSRSEREALELGYPPHGAADWPLLTDWVVDAVHATHRAVFAPDDLPSVPRGGREDGGLCRVTRIDLRTLALAAFPLLPEPLCPHCTTPRPDTAEAARMHLVSRPKPRPDGYRLRELADYPLPAAALANPVCGALGSGTWLNPASTTTAPVAGSQFVRGYAGLNDVTWSGQANAYGTSRRLAYLEGLERYAGTHARRGASPVTASYHALREAGKRVLNPAECGCYAPATYRDDPLVSPFDPDRAIPWVWGHSLREDEPLLVPARLVYYSAGVAADNFVFECSNGCATGSCPEEAILWALLELVERDAFLLAWFGRTRLTRIELESCRGGDIRPMIDRAALHGYDVYAFDTRMDLAVPVVTALAVRRDRGPGTLSFSGAAGLDPEQVVGSALSEVLTYIPHLPRQVAERRTELEAMAVDFTRVRQLKDHAQLYGLPQMTRHAREFLEPEAAGSLSEVYADWEPRRPRTGDLLDDLRLVRAELVGAGYDVIAVDQTTPEQRRMGLHTIRAIVPGLLPLDFGWTRQRALRMPRLRTAPAAAGRRDGELSADEIKVVPHPFP